MVNEKRIVKLYLTVPEATSTTLAKQYGVSPATICQILKRNGVTPGKQGGNKLRGFVFTDFNGKPRPRPVLSPHKRTKNRDAMLAKQNGRCDLCKMKVVSHLDKCVDHCHKTHRIRAVLCHQCNVGLGCFEDNPHLLQLAIDYLARHKKGPARRPALASR